ncbi:magnesium transporter [Spiroplasma endosymbiont of Crioceris asparagi]|uniref:magnesium transporter n=1 Tax=Spiroplasma endosymbiont of Crioceris asparagi TaxID=3066286 RepID=UPI0030D4C3EF
MELNDSKKLEEIKTKIKLAYLNNSKSDLEKLAEEYYFIDIAEAINDFDDINYTFNVFMFFDIEAQAEMFEHLKNELKEKIVSSLSSIKLKEIFSEIDTDEIVEILEDVDKETAIKILKSMDRELRSEVNQILKHDDDSVGSIMSTEFISLNENLDVKECKKILKIKLKEFNEVKEFYVVNDYNMLIGTITLKEIFFESDSTKIKDIMETRIISLKTNQDQEEIVELFKKYEVTAMPIVDEKNVLVGVITVDDVLDVIEEEINEDIYKIGGVVPHNDDYFETSIFSLLKNRFLMMFCIGVIGMIIQFTIFATIKLVDVDAFNQFQKTRMFLIIPALTYFFLLISTKFTQTYIVVNRCVSLREVDRDEIYKIYGKELLVCLGISGLVFLLSIINFILLKLLFVDLNSINKFIEYSLALSLLVVFLSFVFTIIAVAIPTYSFKYKKSDSKISLPILTGFVQLITIVLECLFIYLIKF